MYNYKAYLKLPRQPKTMNPALKKLGFSEKDKVVILHADDIGMCHASVKAYEGLMDFALISSATIMTPCPWRPSAVALCNRYTDMDIGVHLTVNSEWDHYRWGPLSTRSPDTGLIDDEGYFHRKREEVVRYAKPDAVRAELDAQVKRAVIDGLDVTHVDEHMGTVTHPRLLAVYAETALKYRVPPLLLRHSEQEYRLMGFDAQEANKAYNIVRQLEEQAVPLLDHYHMLPLQDTDQDRVGMIQQFLETMPPGLTHLAFHPAVDTPELRAMAPRDWRGRVADYQAFTNEKLKRWIQQSDLHVIGYRALRELMR